LREELDRGQSPITVQNHKATVLSREDQKAESRVKSVLCDVFSEAPEMLRTDRDESLQGRILVLNLTMPRILSVKQELADRYVIPFHAK